ncbi:hypothetical protein QYM36_002135 [Artemia franciscana]|uniref:Uncharacterized protein n=1 Tax=Artemia franciscana TaxID=6661 RepID=A0AA88IG77_ARTSF|nr:hypothetical protein QYM36_002135 [Artemia franciscana]
MVLSEMECALAHKSNESEIRSLFEIRETTTSFYRQCCVDMNIQTLLKEAGEEISKIEVSYNNRVIHFPVKHSKKDPIKGPGGMSPDFIQKKRRRRKADVHQERGKMISAKSSLRPKQPLGLVFQPS